MQLTIEHRLAFAYDGYVRESFLELRVQPKPTPHQTVGPFTLAVGPASRVFRYRDWNDNVVHHFNVTRWHQRIEVVSRSTVATRPTFPALAAIAERVGADLAPAVLDFLQLGGPVLASPALRRFHRGLGLRRGASVGEIVAAIGARIRERFAYRQDVTRYDSTTDDFLRLGAGVCQDFTHLMLGALRLSGIPCRYVSGYLHVESPLPEPAQSHAWVEFHAPAHGWVPFDPTHDRQPDERYVVVAHGRHYDDVPPNRGIYRGAARETLRAEVHTRVAPQRGTLAPREDLATIDVPVFRELPERRPAPAVVLVVQDDPTQQQQQQQQSRWEQWQPAAASRGGPRGDGAQAKMSATRTTTSGSASGFSVPSRSTRRRAR